MTKLGIFVGEEKWTFFREIFEYLSLQYNISVFEPKVYKYSLLYGRLNRWSYQRNISLILRRNNVCFFEWASDLLMHASQKPKYCGIVTRLHSFELYEWAPKINWKTVDKIILVSGAMQQKFCNLYPDQAYKTVVINNGISFDKFSPTLPTSYNLRIGMLCNIHPIKRVYEMVLTLYEIKMLGLKVCLDIAGNPDIDKRYTASIIRLVKELNLHDSVILEGYVADTTSWLQKIDIFISNSYWEGQQVALLEAMASGCYCLSHHWDGANELLPPNNLFYTSSELIEKILNYSNLSDNEKMMLKKTMHDIAYEKFDIRKTITQISQVIDEVSATSA